MAYTTILKMNCLPRTRMYTPAASGSKCLSYYDGIFVILSHPGSLSDPAAGSQHKLAVRLLGN